MFHLCRKKSSIICAGENLIFHINGYAKINEISTIQNKTNTYIQFLQILVCDKENDFLRTKPAYKKGFT